MKIIFQIIKYVLVMIVLVPILFVGTLVFMNVYQARSLKKLCSNAEQNISINKFLTEAEKTKFKVRTGGPNGKNEDEWFDREYLRYGIRLRKHENIIDDYSIVFAKPGIGFYACIITHQNDMITGAWFEDNAD